MFEKSSKINNILKNLHNTVNYNIDPYKKIIKEINRIKLDSLTDCQLKQMSKSLKDRVRKGAVLKDLLIEAYALTREVSARVLTMIPFDTQLMVGIALHEGKISEMQTGEGKTLAAVMPAFLNALTGKGVHILTVNDYLAQRDAELMKPVYDFLGVTVSYIKEGMDTVQRQKAYSADITYLTAKEAGFDYLRDFLCTEKENLVHRPFNYVIIDEADSILIDEARVPLVIAGNVEGDYHNKQGLSAIVRELRANLDYEIDQYESNVYLTDTGLIHVEDILGCGNIYDPQNLELLTALNCALHAELLLKKDRDYIVRNDKIELIDEFTGRIADKRHWQDNLHAAVEAKEGLQPQAKGVILGSIALQYFVKLYPVISGMTGTARTAAAELRDFYDLDVVVIPTNKPCIRKEHPDLIFTHKEAKEKTIISKIKKLHMTGQPVMVGTASVEESEKLAEELIKEGLTCNVLNAKNDEMEAKIIAKAGQIGAVTVSTNMAGRGTDIKLGGGNAEEHAAAEALGGLYIIGTSRHESRRIDNQLTGRAGRQGDHGESQFFVSFEDELVKRYDITKLFPFSSVPDKQESPIDNPSIRKELERGQRIIEGYNSDVRRQLYKYSFIIEQQRRIIHSKRQDILMDKMTPKLLEVKAAERYSLLCRQLGAETLQKAEKQLALYYINKCWADYLDYISYIRESIHLQVIGKNSPLHEFNKLAVEAFVKLLEEIETEIVDKFNTVEITRYGINMEKENLKAPSSTWTYLINDSADQFSNLPHLIKAAATYISGTLFSLQSLYKCILGKKKFDQKEH